MAAKPPRHSVAGRRPATCSLQKVVTFENGSLYKFEDPIPYESKYPQGLRYTTVGELRSAETTDDML